MNRVERLFGILILLQSKKYISAEDIAGRFEISVRTVYRDVKALSEQGVPVCFEPHKGYSIVQGFFLPPVSFSTDEANALLLMEQLVKGFSDKSIQNHYSSALTKVRSVLRGHQKTAVDSMGERVLIQLPQRLNQNFEYLSSLQQSISSRHIITLEYTNSKSETSTRTVEPIGLIFYAFGWHLIGWCYLRNEYRDFKVSRIVALENTGRPFRKNDHIELAEYMQQLPVNF